MPEPETEKYGVEESEEDTKTAAEGKKCPSCGGDLRPREVTGILLCTKCGSKPFEAKENKAHAKHR